MANEKVTDLTALATPALEDLLYIVDDPSGTPVSKSATLTVIDALLRSNDLAFVATATATVANTASETTIIGTGVGSLTLVANFFSIGKSLRIKLMGVISNTGTPTINIRFKLGATTICLSGAVTTPASLSNDLFVADILLTCRTIGATGTVFAQGQLQIGDTVSQMPATAAVTVDTTGTLAVNVTAEWGAGDPANTISVTNAIVEKLN